MKKSATTKRLRLICCDYINPKTDTKSELVRNGVIVLKPTGKGQFQIVDKGPIQKMFKKYGKEEVEVMDFSTKLVLPTFFDMHFHWVQDDVRLMPKDSLLEWLSKYTWPYEAKFKDLKYTQTKAEKFALELVQVGTLGGACYSSLHPHATEVALKEFVGDFVVGNVLMDMNSPDYLTHSTKEGLKTVEKLSKKYKDRYALTPRFAPTTSPELMKASAKIAKKNKSFIQSHLSETPDEINYVLGIYKKIKGFEKVKTYTEIYHKSEILSDKTIMGHGIYLSDDEMKLLAKTKTAIAHCPTSNAPVKELGLGSGLFDFKRADKFKVRWALGSDIGGGPFLSMFDVMKSFVQQNKKKKNGATYERALFRATLMGAKILNQDKVAGSLDKGKWANFIVVPSPDIRKGESSESVLKLLLENKYISRDVLDFLVEHTFYKGELYYSRPVDESNDKYADELEYT